MRDEFKIQEDVRMYRQLHGYDDFHGSYMPGEADLTVISRRIYEGFAKPPIPTLNRHLFFAHIPKKLFKVIRALCAQDKKGGFSHERSFRGVAEIPISRSPMI